MRVREEIAERGWSLLRAPELVRSVVERPWEVARAIAGAVSMLERQPIRPIEGGRSFASSRGPAPFHTDSQLFRGRPAHWQVLFCVRAAARGGTSLVADGRLLLARIEREDPALHDALFRVRRSFPFVFGDLVATTIAAIGPDVALTHSPRANDPIGVAIEMHLGALPHTRVDLAPGDVLVVDNHRCLHGRTAFDDPRREIQRLLLWLEEPTPPNPAWHARARAEGSTIERIADRLVPPADAAEIARRRAIVEQMLSGTPPGVLSQRYAVPESWLYAFRDAFA